MASRPWASVFVAVTLLAACEGSSRRAEPEQPAPAPASPAPAPRAFTVKVTGHGRPIILIPGLASSGETWTATAEHLGDRYACHVVTLAGFAGVPAVDGPLLARVRQDLARYMEEQRLDHPVVMGHSLGGNIALDLAARHPDRIGPVVIVDSLPFLAGAWLRVDTLDAARPMIEGMRKRMEAQTPAQYEAFTRSAAATKNMVTSPDDLERITAWGLASDQATVSRAMIELLSEDLRADLARIESPALVIGTWIGVHAELAENGMDIPKQTFERTFRDQYGKLSRMTFAMSDTARHFVMLDDPKWFFAQLDRFLADPAAAVRDRGFAN